MLKKSKGGKRPKGNKISFGNAKTKPKKGKVVKGAG
jgi:hypothetical protein